MGAISAAPPTNTRTEGRLNVEKMLAEIEKHHANITTQQRQTIAALEADLVTAKRRFDLLKASRTPDLVSSPSSHPLANSNSNPNSHLHPGPGSGCSPVPAAIFGPGSGSHSFSAPTSSTL